jgi:non-canonical (house-cleaning) NTP pyrophosphatase
MNIMSRLFLYDPQNKAKATGVEVSLSILFPQDQMRKVSPKEPIDIRPVKRSEISLGAEDQAHSLLASMSHEQIKHYDDVYAIGIQKGVNFRDDEKHALMLCTVTIVSYKTGKIFPGDSSAIHVPEEARILVRDEGMEIYDAWQKVFKGDVGIKIKEKRISIYEHLTGKEEFTWISDVVHNALTPLRIERGKCF